MRQVEMKNLDAKVFVHFFEKTETLCSIAEMSPRNLSFHLPVKIEDCDLINFVEVTFDTKKGPKTYYIQDITIIPSVDSPGCSSEIKFRVAKADVFNFQKDFSLAERR